MLTPVDSASFPPAVEESPALSLHLHNSPWHAMWWTAVSTSLGKLPAV